jgi:hypothetical protein
MFGMKILPIILTCLALQGCVTATKQEVATADFGPLPADYQERVKSYMSKQITLRPETAVYEFGPAPRKGFCQAGLVGPKKRFGWIVPVKITVKNHFGFHVSENCYIFLRADGTIDDCTQYFGQLANYVD